MVREGQAAGEIDADADVDDFALTFAALLDGLSIQVALEDPAVDSGRARSSIAMGYAARELGFDWRRRASAARRHAVAR